MIHYIQDDLLIYGCEPSESTVIVGDAWIMVLEIEVYLRKVAEFHELHGV